MNLFHKIFSKKTVLLRCNYCDAEVTFSLKFVQQLEQDNKDDLPCPPKTQCHYCHMGFVLPVSYKSKNGTIYTFDDLADKIPHLDQDSFFDRLLDEDNF